MSQPDAVLFGDLECKKETMMYKKILPVILVLLMLVSIIHKTAFAATTDVYVSTIGNDANACTVSAPCRTIQKGVNVVQPGGVLHILAGTYSESVSFSKVGTQSQPIRIVGEGAILSNGGQLAFSIKNSQWITFEGLTVKDYTLSNFEISQSHYLTFRNNSFEYTFAAVRIKDSVSHVLVENNEMYQTYPAGSTWSSLKGSKYEGGGVYASTGGQGMYIIRGNNFHDSMNGVYLSDDGAGQWMNANIFISGNTFRNIVDDPFEPEGDSFNLHFYNNILINTHRMASIVPDAACIGPIFVYGNYQQNTIDPTGEASTGRRNSVIKMDMSGGTCPNGVWVFNNTANANVSGTNFYGVDLLTSSVKNYRMMNNVLVTEKNAYSGTPVFTNATSDYNISLKPFGYIESHSLQADPLLSANGTLQVASPAKGRGASIDIANYFVSAGVVPTGTDLGAFRSFVSPKYVLPPGGEPADFPATVAGWPDAVVSVTATSSAPTLTATPVILASATVTSTQIVTQLPTFTKVPASATVIPATSSPTTTSTLVAPTFTATSLPPTTTPAALPTLTSTSVPPLPTFTALPTSTTSTPLPKSELVYNDTNPALIYSENWQDAAKVKAYEGSFKYTNKLGSFVTLSFTGQSISLLYETGKGFGKMDVYIDNQLIATLNQRTSQNQFQKRWDYQGTLPTGQHELKLIFNGPDALKGSLDAIVVR
jgi:hypothetical protein